MLNKLIIILSVYLLGLVCGEIQAEPGIYRLPNQTYPESYEVFLGFNSFDRNNLNYTGSVRINVAILEDTKTITLHSSEGDIKNIIKILDSGTKVNLKYTVDSQKEFLIISELNDDYFISNTVVIIEIQFESVFSDFPTTQGIYRGIYSEQNLTNYFLASHMEPTYARKVFPCYDEPRFRSTFNLSIMHSSGYHAISNTDSYRDVDFTDTIGAFLRNFGRTPSIPTYMLAFVVSKFKSYEFVKIQNGLKFRVSSRPDQLDRTNFGFQTGIRAVTLFEDYFDVSYQSEKLDIVSLAECVSDTTAGQGTVFYQEDSFLYDGDTDTAYQKELVSRNIFNKICRTIIGNSLTYSWWSSVWLNKGLCKFYEYHMTNSEYPAMRLKDIFNIEVMQPEMSHDSSPLAHPLTRDVKLPSEIRSMFDSISYSKAASVIRMFHHALSEETFRRGLQIYISKRTSNPEGITEPKHFYEALQLAVNDSSLNVAKMFETWEFQAGYPIVYVTRNYNENEVTFEQKRFTDDIKSEPANNETWTIPMSYSTNSKTQAQIWLLEGKVELTFEGIKPSDYLLVNVDQTGYYRVMYDVVNWIAIANELNEGEFKNISPKSRAMLIDDAATFVETEILDMKIFLHIINYLQHETDYIPWMSATNNLLYMRRMLNDGSSKLYNDFQKFLQLLFTKVFETYGVQEQNDYEHHQKHIRNIAINWACQAQLPECLNQTADLFDRGIMNSEVTISTDHRAAILCNGARTGNCTTFDFLWNSYTESSKASDRYMYLNAMGCIEEEDVLTTYIKRYQNVTDNDWFTVIQSVYMNGPIGLKVAMEFLNSEYEEFYKFLTQHNALDSLDLIFQGIADHIVTDERYDDFSKLMSKYGISPSMKKSLEALIDKNLEWIEKNSPIIYKFLNSSRIVAVSLTAILFGLIVQYLL